MVLTTDLADYVIALDDSAASTRRKEDRALYEKYRAHAGLLLALAVAGGDDQRLREEIEAHERLWVHSWLVDDAYQIAADAWRRVSKRVPGGDESA